MKKFARILALVPLMAIFFSSLTVNAASPKLEDYFPQTPAPTEEEQINPTTWNYHVGVDQLTDPAGSWSWYDTFDGKPSCWGQNNHVLPVDCNLKTIYWDSMDNDFTDKGATHVRQIVFADAFTKSGLGDYGRQNPQKKIEDFEQITVFYSADGENWTATKNFTVAFHTEVGTFVGYDGTVYPYDTFWHLILDEAIPVEQCKFMGFHSSEAKAWDAQGHIPSLGIILNWKYTYLVKDTGTDPVLNYPAVDTACAHSRTRTSRQDPTCDFDGYVRKVCTSCGEMVSETVLPATDHAFGPWRVEIEPTPTMKGVCSRVCASCGQSIYSEFLYGETLPDDDATVPTPDEDPSYTDEDSYYPGFSDPEEDTEEPASPNRDVFFLIVICVVILILLCFSL